MTAEPCQVPRKHPLPQIDPVSLPHPRRRTCPAKPLHCPSARRPSLCPCEAERCHECDQEVQGGALPTGRASCLHPLPGCSWRAPGLPGRLVEPQGHGASGLLVLVPRDTAPLETVGKTKLSITLM